MSRTLSLTAIISLSWAVSLRSALDSPQLSAGLRLPRAALSDLHHSLTPTAMASVESVPAYMLPGVRVEQPAHLEGDASLATEILPGPPPLLSVQQAGLPRKDHRKTVTIFSYLPSSDPGTTYTGHMVTPMAPSAEVDGPRRKRARLDKGSATSRAQRASARNLNSAIPSSDPPVPSEPVASSSHNVDSDPSAMAVDSDDGVSRSNSLSNLDEHAGTSNLRKSHTRKDKGKGREKDALARVKEEPSAPALPMGDPFPSTSNEDHCSSCRSLGSLIYCDGCPRAFHLWCLNPPLEQADLPEGDTRWFCPACILQQKPPPRPSASLKFMAPLIEHVQSVLPIEFQLPSDIRHYFKDVGTGPWGTYVDTSELKQPRMNRHGQLEERDPYRLKDRNGEPVLCFRCGTSALPPGIAASAPAAKRARRETSSCSHSEPGRSIISCDYCPLHWHLDCVDPPLASMPPWGKKWMCPNHADRVLQPKRRIPKQNAAPVEITKPHQHNNGNIEIIHPESIAPPPPKIAVDEVLINGRRYRVPEKIITLDFWTKLGKARNLSEERSDDQSILSSPLTSLSSLAGDDDIPSLDFSVPLFSLQDIEVAQLLTGLQLRQQNISSQFVDAAPRTMGTQSHEESSKELEKQSGSQLSSENHSQALAHGQSKEIVDPKPPHIVSETVPPITPEAKTITPSRARRSATVGPRDSIRNQASKRLGHGDDEEYVPVKTGPVPSASSRPKRAVSRKSAVNGNGDVPDESVLLQPIHSHPNGIITNDLQPVSQSQPEPMDQNPPPVSARTKRAKYTSRRRHTPTPLVGGSTSLQEVNEPGPKASSMESEEPDTPLSALKLKTTASVTKSRSIATHSDARPALTKPPITSPPFATKFQTTTPTVSTTKPPEPTSTPTLKIRLPRPGALHLSSASQPSASSPSKASKPARGRVRLHGNAAANPRRSSRRHTSTSASLNEASASSEAGYQDV